jgi:hypothetical protein
MTFWDGSQWVRATPDSPPPVRHKAARHVGAAIAEAGLVACLVFGLIAGTTFAARGGKGAGGHAGTSATITVPNGVFGGTTTASVSQPGLWVYNACSKGGAVVSQQWTATDSTGKAVLFLGPSMSWTGGSATCVAQAGSWSNKASWVSQGSTTFSVSG